MLSPHPSELVAVGLFCTIIGIVLIKRVIEGDTLMPGTNFTYLPKWLPMACGILLQLPLTGAWWFLNFTSHR